MGRQVEYHDGLSDIAMVDLRGCTRAARSCESLVSFRTTRREVPWLRFGAANLSTLDRPGDYEGYLDAYLRDGAVDCDHHSARAFSLPLVGIRYEFVRNQTLHLGAWVANAPDAFRVPAGPYDPFTLPDVEACTNEQCSGDDAHVFIPDGYTGGPPFDPALFDKVVGKRVSIVLAVRPRKNER